MISLKAPHNNLMPYTQQSILNTVKNNQLPEDIKSSLVSCVDIFKVLIKQYYDYPYDCRDDLVDTTNSFISWLPYETVSGQTITHSP